jgi:hypothetical protein
MGLTERDLFGRLRSSKKHKAFRPYYSEIVTLPVYGRRHWIESLMLAKYCQVNCGIAFAGRRHGRKSCPHYASEICIGTAQLISGPSFDRNIIIFARPLSRQSVEESADC